jgi:2-oxoglutarate dehydrogenase E1 component
MIPLARQISHKSSILTQAARIRSTPKLNHIQTRCLNPSNNVFQLAKRAFADVATQNSSTKGPVPHAVPLAQLSETFLNGTSGLYVEEMFQIWRQNPSAVHPSWNAYFKNVEAGLRPGEAFQFPGSILGHAPRPAAPGAATATVTGNITQTVTDSMRALLLIRAYQVRGHLLADLDPLGLTSHEIPPELDIASYGFTQADLDREIQIGDHIISGFLSASRPQVTLRDLLKRLKETYCGTIGFEYMHIQDREKCNWLRDRIETPAKVEYNKEQKIVILDRLLWATEFEMFLAKKVSFWKKNYK